MKFDSESPNSKLLEEFLRLVVVIVTERTRAGATTEQLIRFPAIFFTLLIFFLVKKLFIDLLLKIIHIVNWSIQLSQRSLTTLTLKKFLFKLQASTNLNKWSKELIASKRNVGTNLTVTLHTIHVYLHF